MPTRNPDKTGELSKFYYMISNTQLTPAANAANTELPASDPAESSLLALPNWKEFCIKNLDKSRTFNTREVMDRCNPNELVYSIGRSDTSLSFELNQFRWPLGDLRAFNVAVENKEVFTILALNDERDQTEAWGWIGNFHVTEQSITEPEDGLNTESYTLQLAARSVSNPPRRWIYGSAIN